MESIDYCYNCKAVITEADRAIFKAELFKAGYRGDELNLKSDMCACCNAAMELHHNYFSNFEEDSFTYYEY